MTSIPSRTPEVTATPPICSMLSQNVCTMQLYRSPKVGRYMKGSRPFYLPRIHHISILAVPPDKAPLHPCVALAGGGGP
jgi:hypothetical protein